MELVCSLVLGSPAVDTAVLASFSFPRSPEDPAGVIMGDNATGTGQQEGASTFRGVARFSLLLPSDHQDLITCVSSFQPLGNSEFVLAVNNTPEQYQLQVEGRSLPSPPIPPAVSACQYLVLVSL